MTTVINHGDGHIEYDWDGSESDWEKEAIREYGVEQASEIPDALDWRKAVDAASTVEELRRIQRGKHATEDVVVGRPNQRRSSAIR